MVNTVTLISRYKLDKLKVMSHFQTNTGFGVPTICGQNAGHHIYVDMGAESGDSVKLAFMFEGQSSLRSWEIKASQIPCASPAAPPQGCLQWYNGLKGELTTFNFAATDDNHLRNQAYSICIRQEAGFCCVKYSVCEKTGSFSLATLPAELANADQLCTLDYIAIPGSSESCSKHTTNLHTRYCGAFLSPIFEGVNHLDICDCTEPFVVDIYTDNMADAATPEEILVPSRGLCLQFIQIPC